MNNNQQEISDGRGKFTGDETWPRRKENLAPVLSYKSRGNHFNKKAEFNCAKFYLSSGLET